MFSRPESPQPLSPLQAIIPIICLIGSLGLGFFLFGDEAASGPNLIALVFATMVAVLLAYLRHTSGYTLLQLTADFRALRATVLRLATPGDAADIATMSRDLIEAGLGWKYDAPKVASLIAQPDVLSLVA